jgi:hypothetical protein
MRIMILAAALAAIATPAAALNPPAKPTQPAPLRELPGDWLDDADLDGTPDSSDQAGGSEGDDRLAGGDRGDRRADAVGDCKESSGTTGAILGAVAGGLLGNVIDGGRHRALGTLVGGGGGALLGRKIEQDRAAAGCK